MIIQVSLYSCCILCLQLPSSHTSSLYLKTLVEVYDLVENVALYRQQFVRICMELLFL